MFSASNQFDFKLSLSACDTAEIDLQDQAFYCSKRLDLLEFCEVWATAHLRLKAFVHFNGFAPSRQISLLKFESRAKALVVPFE